MCTVSDLSVQQGVDVGGGCAPSHVEWEAKGNLCEDTQFQIAFVVIKENFLSTFRRYSTTCTL